jgi:hypothetical protein
MTYHDDYLEEAFDLYFASGANIQPSQDSDIVRHKGVDYVRLQNVNKTLAVYEIGKDGLTELKHWPEALEV